ncbi:uncharacterized protein F5Z01DRAFT_689620 [Emericellopsis atlantica]|uniref:Myb-like domain-containing protein n=1 Tax=Emericellopsis atlantica TaxID=2614577 RepID=A0A9P7ZU51_9HYPO|nr:uncharacterized protein F5Z01DRAFT_689620 [Emericellopsis atlantica]KAG9258310.1 hypothetical protein F5Z01DRAFT_689620 [Emericellopsis atlantica]
MSPKTASTSTSKNASSDNATLHSESSSAEAGQCLRAGKKKACKRAQACRKTKTLSTAEISDESTADVKCPAPEKTRRSRQRQSEASDEDGGEITDSTNSAVLTTTDTGTSDADTTEERDTEAETTDKSNGSGWTFSEDAQLRGMKTDDRGPTWVEIARVLHRRKGECQKRWNKIKGRKRGTRAPSKKQTHIRTEHAKAKDNAEDTAQESKAADCRISSKCHGDLARENLTYRHDAIRSSDAEYLQNHIRPSLYPRLIAPAADEYLSQEDCDILATSHSKYKHSKWLEMQANFYNCTGRMVPLSIIRDKCERAEAEAGAAAKNNRARARVTQWVSSVCDEGSEELGA